MPSFMVNPLCLLIPQLIDTSVKGLSPCQKRRRPSGRVDIAVHAQSPELCWYIGYCMSYTKSCYWNIIIIMFTSYAKVLSYAGFILNPTMCAAINIMSSAMHRRIFYNIGGNLSGNGTPIRNLNINETYKYLGLLVDLGGHHLLRLNDNSQEIFKLH
ncbi:unnamed protein product [Lepeophtheirus salmonis]|uniref:(salmon louse) hypothetical protein n=1 Tax=Lepeophtheirus salmonis TaxID=72036 RepID=A0A7R8H250_LEPSM|nr:unnamed protein product [Lepeophtheirus salmonis]CAF2821042.1 unnamed protein product [Lepeophtheirus salmonis]